MKVSLDWTGTQPFGVNELEENAASRYTLNSQDSLVRKDHVRCCVRDCKHWLVKRHKKSRDPNSYCPDHGISVSTQPTYVYKDYRGNFIIGAEILERVKKLKVESWRLPNERSEDALSWNVFMGLSRLGGLGVAFHRLTGIKVDIEPELYLWGVKVSDNTPRTWSKLEEVRDALENRPGVPTEPERHFTGP